MKLDESHPANALLLAHLRVRSPNTAALETIDADPHAYLNLGTHPDIVEYMWTKLCVLLPADCRAIVHRTPALVQPDSGLVFALGYGTQYLLLLIGKDFDAARAAGYRNEQTWTGGRKTLSEETFGPGWLFGAWGKSEPEWMGDTYTALAHG
jgi:hypothetical protein